MVDGDDLLRVGAAAVSIAVALAIGALLVEIVHNVFYVALGMVAAAGTLLILPIGLLVPAFILAVTPMYRRAQDHLRLGVLFCCVTGIQLLVLAGSLRGRVLLLRTLTGAEREQILLLLVDQGELTASIAAVVGVLFLAMPLGYRMWRSRRGPRSEQPRKRPSTSGRKSRHGAPSSKVRGEGADRIRTGE